MNWVIGAAAVASLAGMSPAPDDLRLTAQRAEGARRLCVYGTGPQAKARRIGLGEPCPFRYRAPTEPARPIPPMAIRVGEEHPTGRTVCIYRYAGQTYRTARPAMMSCPLTPSGAMQMLSEPGVDDRYRR